MSEQGDNLRRVTGAIGALVLAFRDERVPLEPQFSAGELRAYVSLHASVAPASPDRVLRELRRTGQLNYRVVSRAASLYEFI